MPTIANPDVITDNTNPLICHVTLSEMPITYNCILEICIADTSIILRGM